MDRPTLPATNYLSVVCALRAVGAPPLPSAPLRSEGARGWKGPSATSAFHRASRRKLVESDSTLVDGATHRSLEQRRPDRLDFDLNKAETAEDEIDNLMAGKQILVCGESSGEVGPKRSEGFKEKQILIQGESLGEVGPRRTEGLKLDLNHVSDNDDGPTDWSIAGKICDHKNGHLNPPPSSSTLMSMNIDLNEPPSLYDDPSDLQPDFGKSSSLLNFNGSEEINSSNLEICIMGTRVKVNQKDFIPQPPALQDGSIVFNNTGEVGYISDHLRVNLQPSSDSGGSGKRKEPEGGLEPYTFAYKHQSSWK